MTRKNRSPHVIVRESSYGSFAACQAQNGTILVRTGRDWEVRDDVTDYDAFVTEEIGRIKRWEER